MTNVRSTTQILHDPISLNPFQEHNPTEADGSHDQPRHLNQLLGEPGKQNMDQFQTCEDHKILLSCPQTAQ